MYIKNSITDHFNVFTLDTANIGNISTSKTQIVLPYGGPLPADLSSITNAAISITIQVGLTVNVLLIIEQGGKKYHYPIKATPEEIDRILQPFFFSMDGKTRHDNGLERYSLGLHQSSFINWKRLTMDENGIDNILRNRQTQYSRRATASAVAQVKQRYTFALHSVGAWAGVNFSAQVSSPACTNLGARSKTHSK